MTASSCTRQRTRVAAEVPEPPAEVVAAHPHWYRLSWTDRFAVAAACEAESRSGAAVRRTAAGVFFGTSTAGSSETEDSLARSAG